jgi:hypothetical protein
VKSIPQRGHVNSHHDLALSRPVRSGALKEITNAPQSGTGQIDPAATTFRADPSHLAWDLPPRCVLSLLLTTRDRTKYSLIGPQFLHNKALSAAIHCETDILAPESPVRTLAARVHRECHLPLQKACLQRNSGRASTAPTSQQPESLISRSLFTQQSPVS